VSAIHCLHSGICYPSRQIVPDFDLVVVQSSGGQVGSLVPGGFAAVDRTVYCESKKLCQTKLWPDVDILNTLYTAQYFTIALQCWSIRFHTLCDFYFKCWI